MKIGVPAIWPVAVAAVSGYSSPVKTLACEANVDRAGPG